MITYNHEPYLREAIESVLAQQTSFELELVIGEDCSADQTRQIALEFATIYPDVVRILPSIERLGPTRNFERTLAACRGKYVALLEGDDFWTNPHKLQRQVEILESHREVALVFHSIRIVQECFPQAPQIWPDQDTPQRTGIRDLMRGSYLHTASVMVRNPHLIRFPEWVHESYMADWPFFAICARRGDIYFIPEPMATYRVSGKGIWSAITHIERIRHLMLSSLALDRGFSYEYKDILRPLALRFCYELAITYERTALRREAKSHLWTYWRLAPPLRDWKAKLRLLVGIQCPRVWRVMQRLRGRPA